MARNYILPPNYRAGQGSGAMSGVKDVLTLANYLVSLKTAEQDSTDKQAELYIKEGIQGRRDKKLQAYEKDMRDYGHELDMTRLAEQVKISKEEEKRKYGEGGYDEKAARLRDTLTRDANKESHNRTYLSAYDTEDLTYDDDGWVNVNKGAVSKDEKAKAVDNVLKMSGITVDFSQDPNSKMQSLYSIFRKGQGMSHPSTRVAVEDGEYNVYYKDTNIRDATPGAFSGQGDITQSLQELQSFSENVGSSDTELQAIDNMFMAGLANNKQFMKPDEYQTYKRGQQQATSANITDQVNLLSLKKSLDANQTQEVADADATIASIHNQFVLDTAVKSGDEEMLILSPSVTEQYQKMIEKIDTNKLDPHVAEAARILFGFGESQLDPAKGITLTKETKEDFFAKFKYLDKEGRGGSPSIAYQVLKEMGLSKKYPIFKGVIEGTNPRLREKDQKKPTIGHNFVMHDVDAIYSEFETSQPNAYRTDILDQHFRNSPFVQILDDLNKDGELSYSYNNGKLSVIFNDEKELESFWLATLQRYPDAAGQYEFLSKMGKLEFELR